MYRTSHFTPLAIFATALCWNASDAGALEFPTELKPTGDAVMETDALKLLPKGAAFYGRLNVTQLNAMAETYGLFAQASKEQVDGILNMARTLSADGKADIKNLGAVIGLRDAAPIWMALAQPDSKSVGRYEKYVSKLKGKFVTGKLKKELSKLPPELQVHGYMQHSPGMFLRHTLVLPTGGSEAMGKLMQQTLAQGFGLPIGSAAELSAVLAQRGYSARDAKMVAKKLLSSKQGKVIGLLMPMPMLIAQIVDTGKFTIMHVVHPLNSSKDSKAMVAHLTSKSKAAKLNWGNANGASVIATEDMVGEVFAGRMAVGKEVMTLARMNDAMEFGRALGRADTEGGQKARKAAFNAHKKTERGCQKLFRLKPMVSDLALAVHRLDRGMRLQIALGLGKKLMGQVTVPEAHVNFAKATENAVAAFFMATAQDKLDKAIKVPALMRDPHKALKTFAGCPSNQLMVAALGQFPAASAAAQKMAPAQKPPYPDSVFGSVFAPDKPATASPQPSANPASAEKPSAAPPAPPTLPKVLGLLGFSSQESIKAALQFVTAAMGMPLAPTQESVTIGDEKVQVSNMGAGMFSGQIAMPTKNPWLLVATGGAKLGTLAASVAPQQSHAPVWFLADLPKLTALSESLGNQSPMGGQAIAGASRKALDSFSYLSIEGRGEGGALVLGLTLWK